MKKKIQSCQLLCLLILIPATLCAQEIKIHSHNDYQQRMPFYQAYAQQLSSIEADVFITDKGNLRVAHNKEELPFAPTFDDAYIRPLVNLYEQNDGRAWAGTNQLLTLLVDIKTFDLLALDTLIGKLQQYPAVFDPAVNPYAVRVVISGNRPQPDEFHNYPGIVSFDGDKLSYTSSQLERISMISLNLKDYTEWNGKGKMIKEEEQKVHEVIRQVHALGKPIRFWGTPDGITAWNTFYSIGVDYINTDQPEACAAFFKDFHKKTFGVNTPETEDNDVARAKRLDKTTAGFQGFRSGRLQLAERIETYKPTYNSDGKNKKVKNIIYLIGDGMGLAQVCVADAVNEGLTLLNIKHLGLQRTQAADAYTTDSAAAGSALATGKKHNNRHISMGPDGEVYPSLTDIFYKKGYACGVLSLGNLADATPAAFYGHSTERDHSDQITDYLLDGKLTVLGGSGMEVFTQRNDGKDMLNELSHVGYSVCTSVDDIKNKKGKVICVDERMGNAATQSTLHLLADATTNAINKLTESKNKGFFLMVEGAKIDYAGHANSLPGSVLETLSFDLAIAEALKYADTDKETLVIITGDHETGGLSIVDGNMQQKLVTAMYMTDDHTAIMLPVYIYGPQADKFTGVYENTELFNKILEVTGINK